MLSGQAETMFCRDSGAEVPREGAGRPEMRKEKGQAHGIASLSFSTLTKLTAPGNGTPS